MPAWLSRQYGIPSDWATAGGGRPFSAAASRLAHRIMARMGNSSAEACTPATKASARLFPAVAPRSDLRLISSPSARSPISRGAAGRDAAATLRYHGTMPGRTAAAAIALERGEHHVQG